MNRNNSKTRERRKTHPLQPPCVSGPARGVSGPSPEPAPDPASTLGFETLSTPVGEVFAYATSSSLRAVLWTPAEPGRRGLSPAAARAPGHPILGMLRAQLREYFAGQRRTFDLPLGPQGTAFQQQVWLALRAIPFGETRTYGEQAKQIGRPSAARAVGAANGRNPLSIVVPCHRVVGATGALTGFAGGIDAKRMLLAHERDVCNRDSSPPS